jgi:pilus assembly protein CpaB
MVASSQPNRTSGFGLEGLQRSPLVVLLVSVLLAAFATYALQVYIDARISTMTGGQLMEVLLAAEPIPAGTEITNELVQTREIPSAYVHPKTVTTDQKDFVLGQRTLEDIASGEPLLWTDLMLSSRRNLTDIIGFGERAVTISVDSSSSQYGLIRPGDRVDVLCTLSLPGEDLGSGSSETLLLLQNVTIVAVDGSLVRKPAVGDEAVAASSVAKLATATAGEATPALPSTVTLKVAAEDARLLAFAEAHGRLTLLLRNPNDVIVEGPASVTLSDLTDRPVEPRVSAGSPGPAGPQFRGLAEAYPTLFEEGVLKGSAYWPESGGEELRAMMEALKGTRVVIPDAKPPAEAVPEKSGETKSPPEAETKP